MDSELQTYQQSINRLRSKNSRRKEDANTVQNVLEMQDRVDVLRIEQWQWNERLQLEKKTDKHRRFLNYESF